MDRKPDEMATSNELGLEELVFARGAAQSLGQQGTHHQSGQGPAGETMVAMQETNAGNSMSRTRSNQTFGKTKRVDDDATRADPTLLFDDGARRIDYVLAFETGPGDDGERRPSRALKRAVFEKALREKYAVELEHVHESNDCNTSFVKLHVPFPELCKWAEDMSMRLPLSADHGKPHAYSRTLDRVLGWCCCRGSNPLASSLQDEDDGYTALFTRAHVTKFLNHDRPDVFFSPAQRSRIAYEILSRARYRESEPSGASDAEARAGETTQKIGVGRLLRDKSYVAAYPLHEGPYLAAEGEAGDNARAELYRAWGRWSGNWYRFQPLDHIRNYYGESIGIYFAWLGYYTSVLIPPSIIGLIVFCIGCIIAYAGGNNVGAQLCNLQGLNRSSPLCAADLGVADLACRDLLMCPLCDSGCAYWRLSDACAYSKATLVFDNPATVIFAAFMALWATFFLEFWKRQQNEIAYDWDMTEFEEMEEERPSFEAKVRQVRKNPVTGVEEHYQSKFSYYRRIAAALSVVAFFVSLVLAVLVSIIIYRLVIARTLHKVQPSISGVVTTATASVIQVVCIKLLGAVYGLLSVKLTEWELHRTQTEHEDSLAFKVFLFQFCNIYGSIFYIAFFKGNFAGYPPHYRKIGAFRVDECGAGGCLIELTIQLAIVMMGKQVITHLMEVAVPRIKVHLAKRRSSTEGRQPRRWEADYHLNPLPAHGMFGEYLEMVLQYGFVTLFVAAFPLAPIFALLNNVIEIRLDASRLLTQTRRPFAACAEDIGTWYGVLDVLSTLAVITNGLVIALTSGFIPRLVYHYTVTDKRTIYGAALDASSTTDGYTLYQISVTSPEVFRQLNATVHDAKNAGVVEAYLEENADLNASSLVCGYRGPKRWPNGADGTADLTTYYWHTVTGRLAFLIAFEHVIFFVKVIIAILVPDVPKRISLQQQREAYLAKTLLRAQDLQLHGQTCDGQMDSQTCDVQMDGQTCDVQPDGQTCAV